MNKKQKRARVRRREYVEQNLLVAAKRTFMTRAYVFMPRQHHDGQLVHRMIKDERTFYVADPGYPQAQEYVTRLVFSTLCGRVLSVGEPHYASTNKTPTCLVCVAPIKISAVDWATGFPGAFP